MAAATEHLTPSPDWDALATSLNLESAKEAELRAYEIAKFVVRVKNDKNSKLILKTGGKTVELTLNR
jgi:hypothetical protein